MRFMGFKILGALIVCCSLFSCDRDEKTLLLDAQTNNRFQRFDFISVDNRTNESICVVDFSGKQIFSSSPKNIDQGKFLVIGKGTFNLSGCGKDNPKPIAPNVKGYFDYYFYQCHKIVVHKNKSVEFTDSYIFKTDSDKYDEACANAEF